MAPAGARPYGRNRGPGRGRSSVGRAPQSHCGGQGFKSPRLHQRQPASVRTGEHQMSEVAPAISGCGIVAGVVAGFVCAGATLWPALGAEQAPPPNFAPSSATGWLAQDDEFIPPPGGPGPIVFDPAHPYTSFYKGPQNPHPTFRVADLTNPILQPWTRERLQKANERSLSGRVIA